MIDHEHVGVQVTIGLAMTAIVRQWCDGDEDAAVEHARQVQRDYGPMWTFEMCRGVTSLLYRIGARAVPADHHDPQLLIACNPAMSVLALKVLLRKVSDFAAADPARRECIDHQLGEMDRSILDYAAAARGAGAAEGGQ